MAQRKAPQKQAPQKQSPAWHVVVAKQSAIVDMDGESVHVHGGARYASTADVPQAYPELFEKEEPAGVQD